jgi:hypothetical protein
MTNIMDFQISLNNYIQYKSDMSSFLYLSQDKLNMS